MISFLFWFAILLVLILIWRFPLWRGREIFPGYQKDRTLLFGHRGVRLDNMTENSEEAIRYAFESGLDGIEFDVRLTKDRKLAVQHDSHINNKHIRTYKFDELKEINPEMLELNDVFRIAKEYPDKLLNLEIKTETIKTFRLEYDTIKAIKASGLENRLIVSSFNPISLFWVRLLAPKLRTGLLYLPDGPVVAQSDRLAGFLHVDAIHPYVDLVSQSQIIAAHKRRVKINTWTVNDKKRISSLKTMGIDAIVGDNPAILLAENP